MFIRCLQYSCKQSYRAFALSKSGFAAKGSALSNLVNNGYAENNRLTTVRCFAYRGKVPNGYIREDENEENEESRYAGRSDKTDEIDYDADTSRQGRDGNYGSNTNKWKRDKDGKSKRDEKDNTPDVNPMQEIIRREMYPGLSEKVIEKLHFPERGLPEGALFDDLPLFPNPFDHSDDPDIERDPKKIRTKPYNFNGANVQIETRDAVIPVTWESDRIGPPRENRRVKITVHVKELGLPIVAAQKLVLMCGPRYNFNTDLLTLTSDRYETRKQNGRYLTDLLESLISEAKVKTAVNELTRRLPVKRGRYLPFNKDLLGSGMVKKQYEGMISEDE